MPTFYSLPVAGAMNEMIERIADVNRSVVPNAYSMRPIQPNFVAAFTLVGRVGKRARDRSDRSRTQVDSPNRVVFGVGDNRLSPGPTAIPFGPLNLLAWQVRDRLRTRAHRPRDMVKDAVTQVHPPNAVPFAQGDPQIIAIDASARGPRIGLPRAAWPSCGSFRTESPAIDSMIPVLRLIRRMR